MKRIIATLLALTTAFATQAAQAQNADRHSFELRCSGQTEFNRTFLARRNSQGYLDTSIRLGEVNGHIYGISLEGQPLDESSVELWTVEFFIHNRLTNFSYNFGFSNDLGARAIVSLQLPGISLASRVLDQDENEVLPTSRCVLSYLGRLGVTTSHP